MFLRHTRENEHDAGAMIILETERSNRVLKPQIAQIIHRLAQMNRARPRGRERRAAGEAIHTSRLRAFA